jgi:ankyrin repeat protein
MDIFRAIRDNNLDRVNQLLLQDSNLVKLIQHQNNTTPLTMAASVGNVDIGLTLINHGADVNQPDDNSLTPLMVAASYGHTNFVIFLLEQPTINPDIQSNAQRASQTALMFAINGRFVPIIELLLDSGADPNIPNSSKNTPLLGIVNTPTIVKLLIDHGADVNAQGFGGQTVLGRAVFQDYPDTVMLLLETPGIDVDLATNNGTTPLMSATANTVSAHGVRKDDMTYYIRHLLAAGADPLMTDKAGKTALDHVKLSNGGRGNPRVEKLLVDAMGLWETRDVDAQRDLDKKFIVARRLRQGINTTQGFILELQQKQLSEGIIRRSEYDNLCKNIQNNLNKPGVIALAKSLKIPTPSNQTKRQLCKEIATKLII